MTLPLLLFLSASLQGILLSAIFLFNGSNIKKKLLGIFLLSFAITILHYVFIWSPQYEAPAIFKMIGAASGWFIPPSLYMFYNYHKRFGKWDVVHLIMPALSIIHWLLAFNQVWHLGRIYPYINMSYLFLYAILILRKKTERPVDRLLMFGYLAYCIGFLAYYTMLLTGNYTLETDYIICAAFTVVIYGVVYYSQREFLAEKIRSRYASSSLEEDEGKQLIRKIRQLIEDEKSYQDSSFNLSALAAQLKVPKYRISQALNLYSDQSFSELVNDYRIREACNLLSAESTTHLKLEAIGEAVGYSNKVSFYKNFKSQTGMSPGQYRDKAIAEG